MLFRTYIVHVLAQQVLQGLAHGVALGYNAFTAIVACAGGVGHEGGATDDALQTFLK